MKSSQAAKEAAYNEAQWTINVYHPYFHLSNRNFEGGVRRQPQHPLFWRGTAPHIYLPLPTVFDRRFSGLAPCTKIWEYQLSRVLTDRKQHSENCAFLAHAYFIVMPNFEDPGIRRFGSLPAYRQAMIYKKMPISCPLHFITEEKSSPDDDRAAHTYLALVSSSLLQERLLLRYLTDEAQSVGVPLGRDVVCLLNGELRFTIDCVPDESTTRERGSEEGWGKRTFRSGKALYLGHYNPERLRGVEKLGQLHKRLGNQGLSTCTSGRRQKDLRERLLQWGNTSQRKLEMVTFHYTATGAIGFSRQGGEGNDPQDLQPTQDPQPSYAQSTIAVSPCPRCCRIF